jgi:hypothetical protein
MGKERVVEGHLLFISFMYVSVCIVNWWKKERSLQSAFVPSRPCLVWAVPYLNVQVPVLVFWPQYSLSPRALQDTVVVRDFLIESSILTSKQISILLYRSTLPTPWHHPLDHVETQMMGHTSIPETLVPDQTTTAGKNPPKKNFYIRQPRR